MKKCDKHHGEIAYDETIYLECPLCKVSDYDDIVEDNKGLVEEYEELTELSSATDHLIEKTIKTLQGKKGSIVKKVVEELQEYLG